MHEEFLEWCYSMWRDESPQAAVTLSNMLNDILQRRIDESTFRLFKQEMGEYWTSGTSVDAPSALEDFWIKNEKDPTSTHFYCCGPAVSSGTHQYSRVANVRDFQRFNMHPSKLPFKITPNSRLSRDQVKKIADNGIGNAAKGKLKGNRPFIWLTETEELEKLRTTLSNPDSDEMATYVREACGLEHFRGDTHLIEIKLPSAKISTSRIAAPTFMDGSPSYVYRSVKTPTGCGRTVNLRSQVDHMPEVVHPEIEFTEEFSLADLGRLKPAGYDFDWEKMKREITPQWDTTSFTEVENYG